VVVLLGPVADVAEETIGEVRQADRPHEVSSACTSICYRSIP
jgi:hypothetical protein